MNNPSEKKIWFPAKRYGWGWGPPSCWQGWIVVGMWFLMTVLSALLLLPGHPWIFQGAVCILAALLISICWCKGEKPRWRWGKD